jgi:hypothetical protein
MPLFEMKPGELVAVPTSTFANEQILERADLQRLLLAPEQSGIGYETVPS